MLFLFECSRKTWKRCGSGWRRSQSSPNPQVCSREPGRTRRSVWSARSPSGPSARHSSTLFERRQRILVRSWTSPHYLQHGLLCSPSTIANVLRFARIHSILQRSEESSRGFWTYHHQDVGQLQEVLCNISWSRQVKNQTIYQAGPRHGKAQWLRFQVQKNQVLRWPQPRTNQTDLQLPNVND